MSVLNPELKSVLKSMENWGNWQFVISEMARRRVTGNAIWAYLTGFSSDLKTENVFEHSYYIATEPHMTCTFTPISITRTYLAVGEWSHIWGVEMTSPKKAWLSDGQEVIHFGNYFFFNLFVHGGGCSGSRWGSSCGTSVAPFAIGSLGAVVQLLVFLTSGPDLTAG